MSVTLSQAGQLRPYFAPMYAIPARTPDPCSACRATVLQDTLRTALALGADRAVHVNTDKELQPLAVAQLLAAVAAKEKPSLCLLGKQAIDDDSNQTVGQRVPGGGGGVSPGRRGRRGPHRLVCPETERRCHAVL